MDPLAGAAPGWSPYRAFYCDPIALTDPTGMLESTEVTKNENGTFTVVGGEADGDKNIYVVNNAKDKRRPGEIVGSSVTEYSFLDDEGLAVRGAIIDTADKSGERFLNKDIIDESPFSVKYAWNARNREKYDFKDIGIDKRPFGMRRDQYRYRGMPLSAVRGLGNGVDRPLFGSARDVGNIGAGYIAGRAGLSWNTARGAFDAYESKSLKITTVEGISTQLAERAGWNIGIGAYNKSVQEMIKGTSQSPFQK